MSDAELLTVSVRCLQSHRLSSGHRPDILRGDTKVLGMQLPPRMQLSNSANPQLWKVFICNENLCLVAITHLNAAPFIDHCTHVYAHRFLCKFLIRII